MYKERKIDRCIKKFIINILRIMNKYYQFFYKYCIKK